MTFTRLTDSATLSPSLVFGPHEVVRTPRHIARELLDSSEVRSTFVPTTQRIGEFQCLFTTHALAKSAASWFSSSSLYQYTDTADTTLNTRFIVWGGDIRITQNELWELRVPYKEIP